ncbi:hypothetical protein T05_10784 [Trichinella murrelli]|uniref:SCAN domain-containing protein 3 n=1 Tax=Trichinella murrelli TaxID=144512 RepID=A0A0V0TW58_9BILA|nr:hypothetical protein T05_10784 [Trichinella murrelli]
MWNCGCDHRLFSQLCQQNDEEFNRLLMHTEVWSLSKGVCLSRFYELFEIILEFFQNKDLSLRNSLKKSVISSFTSKLTLLKCNLERREFHQFPSVAAFRENGEVHDDDIQIYCDHVE